jgi:hypothetical protein
MVRWLYELSIAAGKEVIVAYFKTFLHLEDWKEPRKIWVRTASHQTEVLTAPLDYEA